MWWRTRISKFNLERFTKDVAKDSVRIWNTKYGKSAGGIDALFAPHLPPKENDKSYFRLFTIIYFSVDKASGIKQAWYCTFHSDGTLIESDSPAYTFD